MRENGNINFVLIGAKATGKTVYLASIYLYLKNITSQNGKTIEYLKPLADSLLDGEYPQATAGSLHELMFDYKDDEFTSHVQIDDVDGYFVESMHKKDEATQTQRDILLRNIKNSEGIIFFFPYEENFNEDSIKNFNYEIDTIISQLRQMYQNRSDIPIPAVIAVAKWDRSSDYKADDEDIKAVEYIEQNKILKLAKEKIEQNFSNLKTIPLSSIGEDIEHIKPHNLEKPIQFFLKETYKLWDKRIENLKDNKRGLLSFLSKVHFDMKFYRGGEYNKRYDVLEKEFSNEILSKLKTIEKHSQFLKIQETYKDVIPSLKKEHKIQIEEIGKQFKSKQTQKKLTKGSIFIGLTGLIIFAVVVLYAQSKLMKSESELFSDTSVAYQNNNYTDAMKYVEQYQDAYKDTLDTEHKNKVEEMRGKMAAYYTNKLHKIVQLKSLRKQYDGLKSLYGEVKDFDTGMDIMPIKRKYDEIDKLKKNYDKVLAFKQDDIADLDSVSTTLKQLADRKFVEVAQSKSILEKSLIAIANNIASDVGLDDTDNIDDLLNAFANLGIDSPTTVQKLTNKRDDIQIKNIFDKLGKDIENKNYNDALEKVESSWNTQFYETQRTKITNILNKKGNTYVAKKLKNISDITGIDEYNKLVDILNEISELPKETTIGIMGYKLVLSNKNYNEFKEIHKLEKRYYQVIHGGINFVKISFRAKYQDNDPLGFSCGGNEEGIILKIDGNTYHYDNKKSCVNMKITWAGNSNRFKVGNYAVDVEEYDHYKFNNVYNDRIFELNNNDLIKIFNRELIEKDIGNNYFIGLQK